MKAGWPISCRWARLWSCPDRREVGRQPLARAIAPALGLPLIAKDTIKQALITVLPVPNIETSRLIGTASVALLAVAAETPGAVLESVWHRSRALAGLRRLPGNIAEVFCGYDPQIARQRYALRAGTRDAGHFDAERASGKLWNDEVALPVAGGWPVIEIDTSGPVEADSVIERIRAAAGMTRRS